MMIDGEEFAYGDFGVSDEERAAAGRETMAQRQRSLLARNRRRARRRYGKPLPEGLECARVWRRRDPDELRRRLAGGPLAVWNEDDVLHVLWRGDEPRLSAGVQLPMWQVRGADDLWELSVRIRRLDEAVVSVIAVTADRLRERPVERVWRGPRAAPEPPVARSLAGTVTERGVDSRHLEHPRTVTVYRPPGPPAPMPLCLLADGQCVPEFAPYVEGAVTAGTLPPILVAGLHSDDTPGPYPDGRTRDYLPDIDPPRFAAHLAFAMEEVLPGFPEATHVISAGFSNGASFALGAADRRPDRIAAAVALSPNLPPSRLDLGVRIPRYLAAGTIEGGFRDCAQGLAAVLGEAGIAHRHEEWVGGHDPYWWRLHLVEGLRSLIREALPGAPP
ncbi:alpha/beta hydrolase [Nonomuraea rubra]